MHGHINVKKISCLYAKKKLHHINIHHLNHISENAVNIIILLCNALHCFKKSTLS